ncbi:unnamed protein product [Chondrus crispus]|uniref:Uncharacterized protein n=1 Tax=Chondrus crispus TaxID=2769 RepID=R7QJ25_CHOCR|nr:unnamed protein product [Chondrus crispus]CDF37773.1 unnamed protein product [Chondrus crispus]|eukprot:XP_005717644.1 unnamed protein product [Chondrus crispus]
MFSRKLQFLLAERRLQNGRESFCAGPCLSLSQASGWKPRQTPRLLVGAGAPCATTASGDRRTPGGRHNTVPLPGSTSMPCSDSQAVKVARVEGMRVGMREVLYGGR